LTRGQVVRSDGAYVVNPVAVATSRLALGFEDEEYADLLGKKVEFYREVSLVGVERERQVGGISTVIAPKIIGDKKVFDAEDLEDFDATFSLKDGKYIEDGMGNINSLVLYNDSFTKSEIGNDVANSLFRPKFNLYVYEDNGSVLKNALDADNAWVSANGEINELDWTSQFARSLANKAFYSLTYIDNGVDQFGDPEFLYIYTPWSVAYFEKDDEGDDNHTIFRDVNGTFDLGKTGDIGVSAPGLESAADYKKDNVYLYTFINGGLTIYAQLEEIADTTVTGRVGNRVSFRIPNVTAVRSVTFTYGDTGVLALGALEGGGGFSNVAGNKWSLYEVGGDILYAKNTEVGEPWSAKLGDYAVVLATRVGAYMDDGIFKARAQARIYNVQTGALSWLNITNVGNTKVAGTAVYNYDAVNDIGDVAAIATASDAAALKKRRLYQNPRR